MPSLLLTFSIAVFVGNALNDFFHAVIRDLVSPLLSPILPNTQANVAGLTLQVGPFKLMIGDAIAAAVTLMIALAVVSFTLPFIRTYTPLKGLRG
jgi:large-conductance mechanosensitive channel